MCVYVNDMKKVKTIRMPEWMESALNALLHSSTTHSYELTAPEHEFITIVGGILY